MTFVQAPLSPQEQHWFDTIRSRTASLGGQMPPFFETAAGQLRLQIPYAPLLCCMLKRHGAHHLLPAIGYEVVCPANLKSMADDPFHSDAWLGAGLPLETAYDESPAKQLFDDAVFSLAQEWLGSKLDLISRGAPQQDWIDEPAFCPTIDPEPPESYVLVTAMLAPSYTVWLPKAQAIICSTGSACSHLAIVAKEHRVPILRAPHLVSLLQQPRLSACTRQPFIDINFNRQTVEIVYRKKERDLLVTQ